MLSHLRPRRSAPCLAAPARVADSARHREHWDHSRRRAARSTRIALALALAAAPAAAQRAPEPTPYTRAIAAGYKALTLCNGIFAAGRTEQQVAADELRGIYPEYDAIVPTLPATVTGGGATGLVTVPFDAGLPPRAANWFWQTGCTLAPIGAKPKLLSINYRIVPPKLAARFHPDPQAWPMGDAGIAPSPSPALAGVVARAFDRAAYGPGSETVGMVVVRDGRVVAEQYRAGFDPFVSNRTWSVAKSISGTLVGLAGLDPAKPADIPEWRSIEALDRPMQPTAADPRAAITLDQLLRMASGLHGDTAGNRTDAIYFGGTAVTEQATGWLLEARPGARFRYANNDILLAVRSMRARLGEDEYVNLPARAFDALGMRHTVAEQDWRGNYILSSQVWSTARDLARLGQFWLQDGVWQGKRLLPEGWMHYMTTPTGPQPADGPGYGATMWLFGPKQGLPAGSYAAQGNRGQYVMVIPSAKLVIVRRGEDPGAARFDIAKFSADVLAAVR